MKDQSNQESDQQNLNFEAGHTNNQHEVGKRKTEPTSKRKTQRKIKIILTSDERNEASWVFKQAGYPSPPWLREQFVLTRKRRGMINELWSDSGLDGDFCHLLCHADDWSGWTHKVWHKVNRRSRCK